MERFTVVDVPEQTVAAVRRLVPMAELPGFFGEAFHAVAAAVEAGGGSLAGPPFGWYHGIPTATVDVAAGFPVDGWGGDGGEVDVSRRGGGRAVVTVHVGPYDTLADTYGALQEWCSDQGLVLASDMWEEYLDDPTAEPSATRTRIVWPIAS